MATLKAGLCAVIPSTVCLLTMVRHGALAVVTLQTPSLLLAEGARLCAEQAVRLITHERMLHDQQQYNTNTNSIHYYNKRTTTNQIHALFVCLQSLGDYARPVLPALEAGLGHP